jgi:DNA-binding CsgD family transcriptional regulator
MLDTVAARAARRSIVAAAALGLDQPTLLRTASAAIAEAVPYDAAGWSSVDPITMLDIGGFADGMPQEAVSKYLENELFVPDVNKLRDMVARRRSAGLLSAATGGDPARSPRYRTMLAPFGHEHELRVPLTIDGQCFGNVCFVRDGARPDFSAAETDYVASTSRHIAQGLRVALATRGVGAPLPDAPGMLVISDDLEVLSATSEAERWLDEIDAGWDRYGADLPIVVRSVISVARDAIDGRSGAPPARAHVRIRPDRWLVAHASVLHGASRSYAVIIEPARRDEVLPLLGQAHGLTPREQVVFGMLLRGLSDRDIAEQLVLSQHTAREHARSVLRKLGARNRTELVVAALVEHRAARD